MKKRSGFTVAEMLFAMLIVGIVSVYGLKAVLQSEKAFKYICSNVYHSLDKALYSSYHLTNLQNPFLTKDVVNGSETTLSDNERTRRLCVMLTEYINHTQANCQAAPITSISNLYNRINSPHFTAMNHVRFYISQRYPTSSNADHYYFIIFADVNGTKGPNSINYAPPRIEPDIFAFAAIDIARACPLGPLETDPRFLQTRVTYFNNDDSTERFSTVSKPYNVSKAEAWGYYNGNLSNTFYIEANPLTYNGYIQSSLRTANSDFYNNIYKNVSLTVPAGTGLKSSEYHCVAGSDIECDVIVDKYVY